VNKQFSDWKRLVVSPLCSWQRTANGKTTSSFVLFRFPALFIFQGEDDPIVSLTYTQKETALSKMFRISLFTYSNTGHDVSPEMKRNTYL
jgi:hypothetical protein